jgi:hypothetical protein
VLPSEGPLGHETTTSVFTVHNLAPVATFLGKIGRRDLGGLPVDEFKKRQMLHREAEIGAEQGTEAAALLKETGYTDVRIERDLAGRERVAVGRAPR